MIHVIAQPNPVTGEIFKFDLPGGVKYHLGDLLCEVIERSGCPPQMLSMSSVAIGDAEVTKRNWMYTYPKDGTTVVIRGVAHGDFGSLFLNIASFAAMMAVPGLGPVMMGVHIGTLAIRVGISLVTAVLQNALFAPNKHSLSRGNDIPSSAQASISGISNRAIPYGAVPKIYGRIKNYHPPYGALPYTEIVGKNQRFRSLFLIGYGPVNILSERIGTSPLSKYKQVDMQYATGEIDSDELSLYPNHVNQENLSIRLKKENGWSERRTPANTQEIRCDLTFPQGLVNITSRNINLNQAVNFSIQYRPAGTSTWIDADVQPSSSFIREHSLGHFQVLNFRRDIFRVAVEFKVLKGTYDVRMRRDSEDDLSDKQGKDQSQSFDMSMWTSLTCLNNDTIINIDGVVLAAMRVLADDQLNGNIDAYNMTVEAKIPTRLANGTKTSPIFTRTPAWQVIDVLQGNASVKPLDDSRMNLDKFYEWAEWTESNKRYCDCVISNIGTVRNNVDAISAAGRGFIDVIDDVFTPVFDKRQTTIKGHYSAAVVKNFRTQRAMPDIPDAIVVRFPDANGDQQTNEAMAFNTGYNRNTAVNLDYADSPYATEARQAREDGYYILAEGKFRPDVHTFESSRRWMRNNVGDLIRVQHDVPKWGIASGMISDITLDGSLNAIGLKLNFPALMESGKTYCVRIATYRGTSVYKNIQLNVGTNYTVLFKSGEEDAVGTYQYAIDDVVMYGESDRESTELLIKSIKPAANGSATVTCQDASYDAIEAWITKHKDIGFDANITTPPTATLGTPDTPEILSMGSDEQYMQKGADGVFIPAIAVSVAPRSTTGLFQYERIQVRFRPIDVTDSQWMDTSVSVVGEMIAYLQPVVEGQTYYVQARSITVLGAASDWTPELTHKVAGRAALPLDVPDLYLEGGQLVWSYPEPPNDFKGFNIRYHEGDNDHWPSARLVTPTPILTKSFDLASYPSGSMTWMVKAVDTALNESLNASILQRNFGDRIITNIAETEDVAAGGFTGIKEGCTVVSTDLKATAQSDAAFWPTGTIGDQIPFWGGDPDPFWFSTVYQSMIYQHQFTPDPLWVVNGSLTVDMTVNTPPATVEYRLLNDAVFWGANGSAFWGSDSVTFWMTGNPTEWRTLAGAINPITHDIVEFRWTWTSSPTQVIITDLLVVVDVPDIVMRYENIAISNTGSFIGAGDFNVIKYFNYSLQNDGSGANNVTFDKPFNATTGVKAYTKSGGTGVAGTIDAIIGGY